MFVKSQIDTICQTLIAQIRAAVEKNNRLIEVRRLSCVYDDPEIDLDECDEGDFKYTPLVVASTGCHESFFGCEMGNLSELFIDSKTSGLKATIRKKNGDEEDVLLQNVYLECLAKIVEWLIEQGLTAPTNTTPALYCPACGGTNVQVRAWIKPNQNNGFVEYFMDNESDQHCDNCDKNLVLLSQEDLLEMISNWWNERPFYEKEAITGLWMLDYPVIEDDGRAFMTACQKWWSQKPLDEKIKIWKSLTTDKRCDGNY